VPLVLNSAGRRLAKRDGDVTLRELGPAEAVQWMARTLGLEGSTAAELLPAFDPARVPREPTTWIG
jgi:glutamyl-tRNA synthetase